MRSRVRYGGTMIITNRYKEKDMKDLDQSDVNADAEQMMQKEFEQWNEHIDPADLYTVIALIIDSTGDSPETFIESALGRDIIESTQSNPKKAEYALRQMIDLDNAMAEL